MLFPIIWSWCTFITNVVTHSRIAFSQKMKTMFTTFILYRRPRQWIVRVMESFIIAVKSRKEGTGQLRLANKRQRKICVYFVFVGVQNTGGKGSRQFVQCPNMIIFLLTMVIPVQPLQIPPPKCNPPSLTQPQSPKAGLTKIFFFRYLIWNVLWKCVNFHCMNLRQNCIFSLSFFSF